MRVIAGGQKRRGVSYRGRYGKSRIRSVRGVVILNFGAGHNMDQIAGNGRGASVDDCAYGTYCTIDLGGPKIITFNDVADIQEGQFSDEQQIQNEELNEPEALQK